MALEIIALSWPLISQETYQIYGNTGAEIFYQWEAYIIMAPTLAATFLIIGGVVRKGIMKERWADAFMVSSLIIGLYSAILLAEFVGDQADFTLLLFVFLNVLALCSAFLGSWGWLNKAEKHQMSLVIRD